MGSHWDDVFGAAWDSFVRGSYGVGAILVSKSQEIVAVGRNLIYSPIGAGETLGSVAIAHAELNALAQVPAELRGLTLMSTLQPCYMCTAAIAAARVSAVSFAAHDPGMDDVAVTYAGIPPVPSYRAELGLLSVIAELMPLSRSLQRRGPDSTSAIRYRERNPDLLDAAYQLSHSHLPTMGLGDTLAEAHEVIATRFAGLEATPPRTPRARRT